MSSRPKVVLVSDTPALVKSIKSNISEFAEVDFQFFIAVCKCQCIILQMTTYTIVSAKNFLYFGHNEITYLILRIGNVLFSLLLMFCIKYLPASLSSLSLFTFQHDV